MPLENKKVYRLAVVVSHPIQYQAPFFRLLAKCPKLDLKVFYCSDRGLKEYKDEGFGQKIKWDIPLLEGYSSKLLTNVSPLPSVSKFWGLINPQIPEELNKGNYDALWIHGWSSFTNWLAMYSAFSMGLPVLLRSETNLLPEISSFKFVFKKAILSRLFKNISGFLSIGRYNTEFYKDFGVPEEKIFLVPYTVDNDFFISKAKELFPKKLGIKNKFNLPRELPVILFSGKLTDVKKPMDLLMTFEMVSKDIKSTLVYLGDGPLRKRLEDYALSKKIKNVYFMGFKNQTELPEFYALADVFVLPSKFEPWGLVVNEAMCFGLPIIVSNKVGASGDLVKNNVNGFIYTLSDVNALAKHLEFLLVNLARREEMGMKSKEIISKWTYKEGVKGLLNCLINITKAKH